MARATCKSNVFQLISLREISSTQQELKEINWKILRSNIINSGNESSPERIATFLGAKSCSRIIYSDGYLIVKDINSSNTLKVYNLNGPETKLFLNCLSIPIYDEWKDRSFGIRPVSNNKNVTLKSGFKTGLYYITARKLHVLNFHNGRVDTDILLPDGYRFSELSIDDETHTLAVSSVKNPKSNTLMVFALYEYYPQLIFNQILEIKKSVLGQTLVGAEINQGLLLTLHKGNKIQAFSLAAVCDQQDSPPPILMEVISFNHVLAIGSTPYHLVTATRYNSFFVQQLEGDEQPLNSGYVEGNPHTFDSYLGFHPDTTPRLIFTDKGKFQIFNITVKDGLPSLVPGISHSLADSRIERNQASFINTASGRVVKRPVSSTLYYQTNDDDEMVHLAWDYEDDLNILGVLYARQLEGRHSHVKLTLDLIDSPSGQRLRRMELDPKIRVSSFESIEVFLRLDADRCLISIARSSRVSILVFRLVCLRADEDFI